MIIITAIMTEIFSLENGTGIKLLILDNMNSKSVDKTTSKSSHRRCSIKIGVSF